MASREHSVAIWDRIRGLGINRECLSLRYIISDKAPSSISHILIFLPYLT